MNRFLLLVLVVLTLLSGKCNAQANVDDLSDIPADKQTLFYRRTKLGSPIDPLIAALVATGAPLTRSYAVVIAISEYPHFNPGEQHLPPAEEDLANLKSFLIRQKFDEIIVLHNDTATKSNIDYVLGEYLPHQLDTFGPGARVLITYTGHGAVGSTPGTPGFLVLSSAQDGVNDYPNFYSLSSMETDLKTLSAKSFQLLAVINSCHSGGLFYQPVSSGGNDLDPSEPGAHAITASKADELAYALPNMKGSIFFDAMIEGIDSGKADYPGPTTYIGQSDGSWKAIHGGIIRFGALTKYISDAIGNDGINPSTNRPYSKPIWGSIMPIGKPSFGAFFFLAPYSQSLASVGLPPEAFEVRERGLISKNASYKVFRPPYSYKIYGLDVSSFNGELNWSQIASNSKFKFVYIKGTSREKDKAFDRNREGARSAGIKYGFYHVFNFDLSADAQFKLIQESIPRDEDALPFTIDIEPDPRKDLTVNQKDDTVEQILKLKGLCSDYFTKPVVVYGSTQFFRDFPKAIEKGDAIWLAQYRAHFDGKPGSEQKVQPPSLPGPEPWTIWQVSDNASATDLPRGMDLNVFFGTSEDFQSFAQGARGVARKYVSSE